MATRLMMSLGRLCPVRKAFTWLDTRPALSKPPSTAKVCSMISGKVTCLADLFYAATDSLGIEPTDGFKEYKFRGQKRYS